MKRIDTRLVPKSNEEIRVFAVVRNELFRLPSMLQHHRSIGVQRFFILDNGSTDGTLDCLLKEPDVHVFSTNESYAQSNYGIVWTNHLLDSYGMGHWTLTIDGDEQFIYPHYEEIRLPDFCKYLDKIGAEATFCLLLDMYSDVAIKNTVHDRNKPLLETCGYFDRGPYRLQRATLCPYLEIYGGVRERMFRAIGTDCPPPTVSKAPLVRWKVGRRFINSTHFLSDAKIAPLMAALLHFKFLSDFHERAEIEVRRAEHFAGAREYRIYLEMLRKNGDAKFFGSQSVKFMSSSQLLELGLMSTSKSYEQAIKFREAKREFATAV
jgi:glycosyltransferase involved in cell wall biosynthesis